MATEKPELCINGANQIQAMFNAVAPKYDFLNRLLSVGFDRHWRKAAVSEFQSFENKAFLDVATGTADIALEFGKRYPKPSQIVGMDFSLSMLKLGNKKISNFLDETLIQLDKKRIFFIHLAKILYLVLKKKTYNDIKNIMILF